MYRCSTARDSLSTHANPNNICDISLVFHWFQFQDYANHVTRFTAVYTLVALTFERLVAVCWPLTMGQRCTKKLTKVIIVTLFVAICMIHAHELFDLDIVCPGHKYKKLLCPADWTPSISHQHDLRRTKRAEQPKVQRTVQHESGGSIHKQDWMVSKVNSAGQVDNQDRSAAEGGRPLLLGWLVGLSSTRLPGDGVLAWRSHPAGVHEARSSDRLVPDSQGSYEHKNPSRTSYLSAVRVANTSETNAMYGAHREKKPAFSLVGSDWPVQKRRTSLAVSNWPTHQHRASMAGLDLRTQQRHSSSVKSDCLTQQPRITLLELGHNLLQGILSVKQNCTERSEQHQKTLNSSGRMTRRAIRPLQPKAESKKMEGKVFKTKVIGKTRTIRTVPRSPSHAGSNASGAEQGKVGGCPFFVFRYSLWPTINLALYAGVPLSIMVCADLVVAYMIHFKPSVAVMPTTGQVISST